MTQNRFNFGRRGRLNFCGVQARQNSEHLLDSQGQAHEVKDFIFGMIEGLDCLRSAGLVTGTKRLRPNRDGVYLKVCPRVIVALWAAELVTRGKLEKTTGSMIAGVKIFVEEDGVYSIDLKVDLDSKGVIAMIGETPVLATEVV